MRVIDLTQMITEDMTLYPGTPPVALRAISSYETDGFRETRLSLTSHTGTHIDAPFHIFGGRTRLEELPPSQFIGKALVIDCHDLQAGDTIGMERIEAVRDLADAADFLLFYTGWDSHWGQAAYFGAYPVISAEICRYALESGKKGLGFDTVSIDPLADAALTRHKMLLSAADILILENLTNLGQIGSDLCTLAALPLKYRLSDGAPARVLAILEEEA